VSAHSALGAKSRSVTHAMQQRPPVASPEGKATRRTRHAADAVQHIRHSRNAAQHAGGAVQHAAANLR
jgi:hypothetical protein